MVRYFIVPFSRIRSLNLFLSLSYLAEKKELLTRAKFEALAESGGCGAVRKAIEKKQKKVNQKEKKKRPYAPGEGGKWPSRLAQSNPRPNKRQRLS